MVTTTATRTPHTPGTSSQKVVVVSKQSHLTGLLETVLDNGHYDVVVVESTEHAYSHIKRIDPHLVIVCLDIEDLEGFQVLSMLKLDPQTRDIPVVTCTASHDESDRGDEPFELPDSVFGDPPAVQLH